MTVDPRITPLATSLPATVPFVGPEAQERASGIPFVARLGANENGFGPSPEALAAMQAACVEVWKYPDAESHHLRGEVARQFGVTPDNVIVGEGIDTLLGTLCRLFLSPGEIAVTSAGAYPTFNYHVAGYGARIETVPYTGDYEDPERLIARAREVGAKLIYIANPDNPMGSHHGGCVIEKMIANVPEGALLILDEAYVELAPNGTAARIATEDSRVIRLRTFSKAHGMAGARIGYGISAKPVIAAFHRVRNHFGMNRVSQIGALAALQDHPHLEKMRVLVMRSREKLAAIAEDNGLTALPSATNFVTIDCGRDGDFARRVLAELTARGIFVRMPFVAPQDRCIRVSCGPQEDMLAFAGALPAALKAAHAAS
ncbi:MAG: pyridoxal phosphate-dependent aminotransferase [Paracoccaceae bacterium]